jgi:hypothetical protein
MAQDSNSSITTANDGERTVSLTYYNTLLNVPDVYHTSTSTICTSLTMQTLTLILERLIAQVCPLSINYLDGNMKLNFTENSEVDYVSEVD